MIRILDVARAQLAIDLNCTEEDLLQEEQIRFCPAAMRKGCRTRKRQKPFLEAVSMGQGIVVSGDPEALHVVQPILKDKRREQIFESPFFLRAVSVFCAAANHFSYQKRLSGTKLFCSGSR